MNVEHLAVPCFLFLRVFVTGQIGGVSGYVQFHILALLQETFRIREQLLSQVRQLITVNHQRMFPEKLALIVETPQFLEAELVSDGSLHDGTDIILRRFAFGKDGVQPYQLPVGVDAV